MGKRLGGRRGIVVLLGTAVALVLVAATAWAAIPDEDGKIYACIGRDGELRVIDADAGEACRTRERALQWSATQALPDAFVVRRAGTRNVPATNVETEIATLQLPPGSYQVTAKAQVENPGASGDTSSVHVSCQLATSSESDSAMLHLAPSGQPGAHGVLTLLASDERPQSGSVVLRCSAFGNSLGVGVFGVVVRAVEVGSITTDDAGPPPLPN